MRRSARLLATLAVGAGVIPLGAIGIAHAQSLELVSAASSAAPIPANDFSNQPGGVSADDRFAVFPSRASNLVADDSNGLFDVFVRDRTLGITERVSVSSDGTQSNGDSALDVDISGDGRFVVFASGATNLVAGDSNGRIDIFHKRGHPPTNVGKRGQTWTPTHHTTNHAPALATQTSSQPHSKLSKLSKLDGAGGALSQTFVWNGPSRGRLAGREAAPWFSLENRWRAVSL